MLFQHVLWMMIMVGYRDSDKGASEGISASQKELYCLHFHSIIIVKYMFFLKKPP